MFALTELVDNPADVTFTSHADLDMGDEIEFEFKLDQSMRDEARPSIVADLLDSKKQTILSESQIQRLKFCEEIQAQANQLKPINTTHKVSAKVQNFLQESHKSNQSVKLNESMKRQISKMISQRLIDNGDSQDEEDDDS